MATGISRRVFCGAAAGAALKAGDRNKRIVFIAGRQSHDFGQHAHYAGCALLAKRLRENLTGVETTVWRDKWPEASTLSGASAVVVYMDGGARHPALPHWGELQAAMRKGAGLVVLHYALCVPKGEAGRDLIEWIGGYYEEYWSVNPTWSAHFDSLPRHPITRGVKPFAIRDEWYYHMRFAEGMRSVTPILTAVPPEATRQGPDGAHSGNPAVRARAGIPEHVAWAYERPGGGRGFGLTGAHFHWAWGHDGFRQITLNAIAWTAGIEVPAGGVSPQAPSWTELLENQEVAAPAGFGPGDAQRLIAAE